MATSQSRTPSTAPNRYDGLAVVVALAILAWGALVAVQPALGSLLTVAFGSTYAAGRVDDLEHAGVVAGLWALVVGTFVATGSFLGLTIAAVVAALGYGYWRGVW